MRQWNANQNFVMPSPYGSPTAIGGTKLRRNLDGSFSVVKARRIPRGLLILGGLIAVVILIMIVRTGHLRKEAQAQPSTKPPANAPAVEVNNAHWSQAQCAQALKNFFYRNPLQGEYSVPATTLFFVSENLAYCENYPWTYEEQEQLALPFPFRQVEETEQESVANLLILKIDGFLLEKNLAYKFAMEGGNVRSGSDLLGFIRRRGLEEEFVKDDDLKCQNFGAQRGMNSRNTTALLMGVVTQDPEEKSKPANERGLSKPKPKSGGLPPRPVTE